MIIPRTKALEAAEVLGIELDGLDGLALQKAYRHKAKKCHPDHHGSDKLVEWSKVSWANECLKAWVEHNPPIQVEQEPIGGGDCRACLGTGRVVVAKRTFGPPLTMMCVVCRGLGTVIPEENDSD